MTTRRLSIWTRWLILVTSSGCLFQFGGGCSRFFQDQLEVLFAADASPTLVYNSWILNKLGPGIVSFFNQH